MKRDMRPWEKVGAYGLVVFILLIVLSPHFGLLLLSFGTIWSYSVLPDAYTLDHYVEVLANSSEFITNTLLYAGLAASADVIFATAIAYLVWRTNLWGRKMLDYAATASLAIPGVVLGIGYLRSFHRYRAPGPRQAACQLVGDHRHRTDDQATALCLAGLRGGPPAGVPCARRGRGKSWCIQIPYGHPHRGTADVRWHSGGFRDQFRDSGSRTFRNHHAGIE